MLVALVVAEPEQFREGNGRGQPYLRIYFIVKSERGNDAAHDGRRPPDDLGRAAHVGFARASPDFAEATQTFLRVGLLSFGGPAGQIATMHRILVDEKRWLDERSFLSALNFCMLLPGPEAMQLATYAGWRLHGVMGGLMAGLLFVLPGALVIFALAAFYLIYGTTWLVTTVFLGIKAAVLVIVLQALLRITQRALKLRLDWMLAVASFVAIYAFALPFPVIVITAIIVGFAFEAMTSGGDGQSSGSPSVVTVQGSGSIRSAARVPPAARTVTTIAVWLAVWIVPLSIMGLVLGGDHVLSQLAWFFSKLAVVTFGGAYAVLAYMAQVVVETFGWLTPGEMLDALGLAETTPGPLILVTQFVSALAAARADGGVSLAMGFAGGVVALWATFAPCFLWIFAGAPYIERFAEIPRLQAALRAVTAAVVGVILNLTVWFALHVLFAEVGRIEMGPINLALPRLSSVNSAAALLALVAGVILLIAKRGIATTLAICGALALGFSVLGLAA